MWRIILDQVNVCRSHCVRSVTDAIPDKCDSRLKCQTLRNRRSCEVSFVCKSNCFFPVTQPHPAFKSGCQWTTDHEIITDAGFPDTSGLVSSVQHPHISKTNPLNTHTLLWWYKKATCFGCVKQPSSGFVFPRYVTSNGMGIAVYFPLDALLKYEAIWWLFYTAETCSLYR